MIKRSLSNAGSISKSDLNAAQIQDSSSKHNMGSSSSKKVFNFPQPNKNKEVCISQKKYERNTQKSFQQTLSQNKSSKKILQPIKSVSKNQQINQRALPDSSRASNQLRSIKAVRTPLLDFYSHQKAMILKNQRQNQARRIQQRRRVQQICNAPNKTFYNTPVIKRKQVYSPNSTLVNKGFHTNRNFVDNNSYMDVKKRIRFSISRDNKDTKQHKQMQEVQNYNIQRQKPSKQLNVFQKSNENHSNESKRILNVTSVDWKKNRLQQQRVNSQKKDYQKTSLLNRQEKGFEIRSRPTMNQTARNGFVNYSSKQMSLSNGFRNLQISQDHKNYLNKFQIMKQIGKGMYGTVYLAREKMNEKENPKILLNEMEQEKQNPQESQKIENEKLQMFLANEEQEKFAIKVYEKFKMNNDPAKFKNIRKQINIMSNLSHPGVIKLYQNIETLTKINLVVQYAGSQSLLDYLKENYPLSMIQCQQIGKQLLEALIYLHQKNIVHRDIKLQNILIDQEKHRNLPNKLIHPKQKSRYNQNQYEQHKDSKESKDKQMISQTINFETTKDSIARFPVVQRKFQLKLIDYGFSTITNRNRKCNAICGTPNYMAPQLISKKQYIGEEVDIWAYGVVMYTIAEGRHPFKAENMSELERIIKKGKYQFRKIKDLDYQNFIKRILKLKGSDRPRAMELLNSKFLEKDFQ